MKKVLIYSENKNLVRELITAGNAVGKVSAFVLNRDALAQELASCGVEALLYEDESIQPGDTAAVAAVLTHAVAEYGIDLVLLSSDRRGKELTGRLAAALNAGCLTDVRELALKDNEIQCSRLAYGGATVAVQSVITAKAVLALSPSVFQQAEAGTAGPVKKIKGDVQPMLEVLGFTPKSGESVNLKAAEVIIAIGLGVAQNDVGKAQALANALKGVLACTKPIATDRKWLEEERIIGLSGAICKPQLAILIGISGQVQFMVGIRDAKTIITINTDENSDAVRMSDYYYVQDAGKALAELQAKLA
jgi:electron transfer flavoprotein alpha subunit